MFAIIFLMAVKDVVNETHTKTDKLSIRPLAAVFNVQNQSINAFVC